MNKEQFENWKKQILDEHSKAVARRILLYREFCKDFDSQVLSLLYQTDCEVNRLSKILSDCKKMFEIENSHDNQ